MAPSQLSAMKMRNFLFGVILGLLAVVHSTPVNTVTQIPAKAEDEVKREAMTDGFLVEHFFSHSLTTESPKRNTTVQSDMIEGSGETSDKFMSSVSFHLTTITPSVSHGQSSTSTMVPSDTDSSSSDSSTTQSPQSSFTSPVPNEAQSSITPDHISASQTTDPAVSSSGFLSTQRSDLRSGDGELLGQYSTFSSSNTETSTASTSTTALIRSKVPVMFARSEGSGSGEGLGSGFETSTVSTTEVAKLLRAFDYPIVSDVHKLHIEKPNEIPEEPQNKGHSTPGWIIILGFIVGVAALVMICVAIATRDKWNRPSQASQPDTKTNSSNQQRELEMETFLHKDKPRENGKAEEYTVIPLDELPEKYSSQ